jgi:hypothetical protein
MFTRPNGDFRFNNLPIADSFKLVLSAIGYVSQEQLLPFSSITQANNSGGFQRMRNIPTGLVLNLQCNTGLEKTLT